MNIRAYVDSIGFVYPQTDSFEDMMNFYLDIWQLEKKGKKIELHKGTGVNDQKGKELFETDMVIVTYLDCDEEGHEIEAKEVAEITWDTGCFIVGNAEGLNGMMHEYFSDYDEEEDRDQGYPCCWGLQKITNPEYE